MTSSRANLRLCIAGGILLTCAVFLHFRGRIEKVPHPEQLDRMPLQFNGWAGRDLEISDDVRAVLGAGDFLSRAYWKSSDPDDAVQLFIAYFPSQRTGDTIHSPRNCLPGAGWDFAESSHIGLMGPDNTPIVAKEYVIAKDNDKQLVIYWYQAHGRSVASEYWAKYYLVEDAITMNRTDGALVRISTPFRPGENISAVRKRALAFAAQLTPQLDRFIPV